MPGHAREYPATKFTPDVIRTALELFEARAPHRDAPPPAYRAYSVVTINGDQWIHDTSEEFWADYRRPIRSAVVRTAHPYDVEMAVQFETAAPPGMTRVYVRLPIRADVEAVFEVFEAARADSALPTRPTIFMGHGRSPAWRELQDYLRDRQHLEVRAFETDPQAGRNVIEILDELMASSAFAAVVHTAEDEQPTGDLRARENVVHETGLFQGKLGFRRAIVVRERGCEAFSNLAGLQEIHFSTGNIREAFAEVLSTIDREFPAWRRT